MTIQNIFRYCMKKIQARICANSSPVLFVWFVILSVSVEYSNSEALKLNKDNIDSVLSSNNVVFINFYADWCRFSNMLEPVWDEAADKVAAKFPQEGKVVLAKVDCDKETSISTRFHITKYPTLKLMRGGQLAKREYRGQRSAEAFTNFITEQLRDPIHIMENLQELSELDDKKRYIVGYFTNNQTPAFKIFQKVAMNLKEDCQFYAGFGEVVKHMHPPDSDVIAYHPPKARSSDDDEAYPGSMTVFDEVNIWIQEKCIPFVREITFENAEELTEEGLPFLILFYHPDDNEVIKKFTNLVQSQLQDEKQNVNFLTADGLKFAHPLMHLGKSKSDLPLIAIDSFRHMYLFPKTEDMEVPGKLKQFLADLYSGKLHREFHYGPDSTTTESPPDNGDGPGKPTVDMFNKKQVIEKKATTPPESTFRKLAPSKNRYTLLRDEL